MTDWNKLALRRLAETDVLMVKFTKLDGTEREMRCTLRDDLIPQKLNPLDPGKPNPRHGHPDILAVFDLDKGEWRSFRLDRVLEVKPFEESNV